MDQVVKQAEETGRPIVITRHGRGVAVLVSVETYDEFQALAPRAELQRAVADAERDIVEGHTLSHDEVVAAWEARLGVDQRNAND